MNNNQSDVTEIKNIKKLQGVLVDLALKIAKYYKLELDFSTESIKVVEEILAKVSNEYARTKKDDGLRGIALEFSAYIVSVIEKNIASGKWERDSDEFGKDTYPYDLGGGNIIHPYSWCLKRIYDGEGENVWVKFNTLVLKGKS